jgi:hypothetical protein
LERDTGYNALLDRLYVSQEGIPPTLIVHPADAEETPGNIGNNPKAIRAFGMSAYRHAKSALEDILCGQNKLQ